MLKKFSLSISTIFSIIFFFAVGVNFPYYENYNIIRNILLLLLLIYIFFRIKLLFTRANKKITLYLILFILIICYTTFINYSYTSQHINTMIVYCISTFVIFSFLIIQAYYNRIYKVIKIFFYLQMLIVTVNDWILLRKDYMLTLNSLYFIGDKFTVTYAHFTLIILYFTILFIRKNKITLWNFLLGVVLLICSFYIILYVDCSSGIIAFILLIFLISLILNNYLIIGTVKHVLFVLGFSYSFVIINKIFLSLPFIQIIIQDYLGHTLTLSNRVNIYNQLYSLLEGHWIFGYGFGTTYELGMKLGNFPNTQNGIMEWIWQCGIIGTILILLLIFEVMKKNIKKKSIYCISALLVTLSFLASVEITINLLFMLLLAIFYSLSFQYKFR